MVLRIRNFKTAITTINVKLCNLQVVNEIPELNYIRCLIKNLVNLLILQWMKLIYPVIHGMCFRASFSANVDEELFSRGLINMQTQ